MRSTSFSPYQAPVTDVRATLSISLPQDSVRPTTSPATLFALTGFPPSYKPLLSTEQFLSARLSPGDKVRAGMVESPQHGMATSDGPLAKRSKRRLPHGHAMRFTPSTDAPGSSDSVVIAPVNQWSHIIGVGGRPQLAPDVLRFRMRGARRNGLPVRNVVTVRSGPEVLDVTETTTLPIDPLRRAVENVSRNRSVSTVSQMPRKGGHFDQDIRFSPDLSEDIYLGKDLSKACDKNPTWDWQSFARCRGMISGPLSMRGQAALLNPQPDVTPHESHMAMGGLLLPASSPLWFLLTGQRPRWLFPVVLVDPVSYTADTDPLYGWTSPDTGITAAPQSALGPPR